MAEIHWLNAVDGKFTNKADWGGGGAVPGAGDDAILDAAGARFTVAVAKSTTVTSVELTAFATLGLYAGVFTATAGTGAGANWGTIAVGDGAALAVGGLVDNAGLISLDSLGDTARLIIASDTTLSGGGQVTLSDYARNEIVAAAGAAVTLTNKDDTIEGSGSIGGATGGGALSIFNGAFGVIDGDGNNADLTIGPGSGNGSLVNAGLIEATGYRTITTVRNMTISGKGRLFAAYFSTLALSDCSISGQTLTTAPDGAITVTGTGTVSLGSKLIEAGTLDFAQTNPVVLTRNLTLSGGGTVGMESGASSAGALVLTNIDDNLVLNGELQSQVALVNEAKGRLYGRSLVIDAGGAAVENAGQINSEGSLAIAAAIDNAGTIATNGGTVALTGAIDNTGMLLANGGTMTLAGAVTGDGVAVVHGQVQHATRLVCAAGFEEDVTLVGQHCTLQLAQSQTYAGQVSGFTLRSETAFDLRDIDFVGGNEASFSGTASSGVLTVTDGTHTASITLIGDYVGWTFISESDGQGGTIVLAPEKSPPLGQAIPPPHALIAAMAGLGHAAPGEVHSAQPWAARAPLLARPHAMTP